MYPGRNGLSQANEYWSGKNPSPAITAIGSAGGFFRAKNAAEKRQQEGGEETYKYCADCGAAAKQARSREKQRRYRERQKTPA